MPRFQPTLLAALAALASQGEAFPSAAVCAPVQGFGPEIGVDRVGGIKVSLSDLDGDGDLDLLGGNVALVWLPGRGDGRFDGRRRVGPLEAIGNVGASFAKGVDMDGDGDLDIALSRHVDPPLGYLAWHENLGADGFGPLEILVEPTEPIRETLSEDLNGDGLADFVVLQEDGQLGWYENLGVSPAPGLALGPFQAITSAIANVWVTRSGDVDGDGDIDLVSLRRAANFLPTQLRYSENLGGGVFAPARISVSASRSSRSLALADMDLDGDLDAVLPNVIDNGVFWHVNDGTGLFPSRRLVGILGAETMSVHAGDFDLDGDVDVLAGTFPNQGGVRWFEAQAGGSFLPSVSLFPDLYVTLDDNLGSDDLTGDGTPDIWCNTGVVRWIDGSVPSDQWEPRDIGPTIGFPGGSCAFDFEGDGDQDLAITDSDGLFAWINDGDAGFYERVGIAAFDSDSAPIAIDVDGDGDDDLVTGQGQFTSPGGVYLSENLGAGQFAPRRSLDVSSGFGDPRVVAADFEGDGDQDLYVIYGSGPVRWLLNDGSGFFGRLASPTPGLISAEEADLDGDGAAEFLSVESQSSTGAPTDCTVVARGWDPAGTVSGVQVLAAFAAGCSDRQGVGLGDVTEDGLLDVVVYNPDLGTIDSLNGLGGGAFAAPLSLVGATAVPIALQVVDVDLDGVPDLLGASDTEAYWYRGLGSAVFAAGERYMQGSMFNGAGPSAAVDFDGDGDLDLLKPARGPVLQMNETRVGRRSCADQDPNSTGVPGTLWAEGSTAIGAGGLTLRAVRLPTQQFGIFLVAPMTGFVPNPGGALGTLCLGGSIGRFNRPSEIRFTGASGTASLALDAGNVPTPVGPESLQPGDTRYFQFWFRDTGTGSPANLTAALELQFR